MGKRNSYTKEDLEFIGEKGQKLKSRLSPLLDEEFKDAFHAKCIQNKTNMSTVIRQLIDLYMQGKVEV